MRGPVLKIQSIDQLHMRANWLTYRGVSNVSLRILCAWQAIFVRHHTHTHTLAHLSFCHEIVTHSLPNFGTKIWHCKACLLNLHTSLYKGHLPVGVLCT